MPVDAHTFYARALAAADGDGRLPRSQITDWDIFPFESDGLTVIPLAAPELPEPARYDVGGAGCGACEAASGIVWQDEHWLLRDDHAQRRAAAAHAPVARARRLP